jgi:hypothetical protein
MKLIFHYLFFFKLLHAHSESETSHSPMPADGGRAQSSSGSFKRRVFDTVNLANLKPGWMVLVATITLFP